MNGAAPKMPDDLEPLFADEELPRRQVESLQPAANDPLRGLTHLASVAVIGRQKILELASTPVVYAWQDIAVIATIVLLAGAPGDGKTTLLFLMLAARANMGEAVTLLDRRVEPAPPNTWLVVIEGEHAEASACRKLVRSMKLLDVNDVALERVILIARRAVYLGSPEWQDVVRLIGAGLVCDIAIDTVARVMPADGSSEQEQVALFDQVAKAIDAAPSPETRPIVWCVSHTRKNGITGELSDVSGSAQRTGQADTVLLLKAERVDGRVVATRVTFAKLREDPDEYPAPVDFTIEGGRIAVNDSTNRDERALEERITDLLSVEPQTKSSLAEKLSRSRSDVDVSLSNLFTARHIRSTTITVRGRSRKAFELSPSFCANGNADSDSGNLTGRFTGRTSSPDDQRTTPDES